jgi:eukaryotic-like serine/threonine-protein kinase
MEELGRGAQGSVYLAEDTRLSRKVALKVLSGAFAPSKATILRFQREAGAASKLDHPGICSVYEAGEADGYHFIAMRYVEGQTPRQGRRRRPLQPRDRAPPPVPRSLRW